MTAASATEINPTDDFTPNERVNPLLIGSGPFCSASDRRNMLSYVCPALKEGRVLTREKVHCTSFERPLIN